MTPFGPFGLGGQVAAITGGGAGIGAATATLFAEAGAHVAILDRDGDAAATVAERIVRAGGMAEALVLDVTDADAVTAVFAELARRRGAIDVLVNNAGLAIRAPATELALGDWDRVIAVNLTASFHCARTVAALMGERGGAMVNVASIMGLSGGLYPNVAYQTTKGGVVNMTRALALEWAGRGIRVNAVAPTYVRTAFIAPLLARPEVVAEIEAATPLGRIAEPEEVAAAILFLASPAAAMITGTILPVDGGYLAR